MSPPLCEAFRLFLEKRLCIENLLYWQDVQQFRFLPSSTNQSTLTTQAQTIVQQYLLDISPFQINVDCNMVNQLVTRVNSGEITRNIFDETQHACLLLLTDDSLPKFLKSNEYK